MPHIAIASQILKWESQLSEILKIKFSRMIIVTQSFHVVFQKYPSF